MLRSFRRHPLWSHHMYGSGRGNPKSSVWGAWQPFLFLSHDQSCSHVTVKKMAFSGVGVRSSWRFVADAGFRGANFAGKIKNRLLSSAVKNVRVNWKAFPSQKTLQSTTSWYSTRTHHKPIHREKPHDLYATLRLTPAATQQQVKDAYYSLSMQFHPDRNLGSEEAHQKFTEITEAYSILGTYDLRKKYDKGLLQQFPGRPHTHRHQYVVCTIKPSLLWSLYNSL